MREYEKKDGTTGASLEVRVNDLTLLGKRDDSMPREETKPGANVPEAEYDSDIPF